MERDLRLLIRSLEIFNQACVQAGFDPATITFGSMKNYTALLKTLGLDVKRAVDVTNLTVGQTKINTPSSVRLYVVGGKNANS